MANEMMELDDVSPAEIGFKEQLFVSNCSVTAVCHESATNRLVLIGQHDGRKDRELDIHILESTAYGRLRARGVCDRGIRPPILRDPGQPAPYSWSIPNMKMVNLDNYTEARMNNLLLGIREIHKAGVKHNNIKPRNVLIVKNDPNPGRVIWIDFNRANTYDEHHMTDGNSTKHTFSTALDEFEFPLLSFHLLNMPRLSRRQTWTPFFGLSKLA
ncbi:hypothetical protein AJ79_03220 [Helicocarpus griseus UAMH5409]|uniref:Protein kinase domain-containing protein n=1 Tax=Helicocarpus griseus UAMH5409 TaxID=1447875 RepID=A0A2B7XZ97_9EURO|nr:hypothetical protein AJ79_03220 [Helicocarpus griseus UAMH5409]